VVLKITLPKPEEAKKKEIKIKGKTMAHLTEKRGL
jgi:hypothetical protein